MEMLQIVFFSRISPTPEPLRVPVGHIICVRVYSLWYSRVLLIYIYIYIVFYFSSLVFFTYVYVPMTLLYIYNVVGL